LTGTAEADPGTGGGTRGGGPLARLFEPVDAASLAALRIAFGLLAAIEAYGSVSSGAARQLWIEPNLRFPAPGLGWLAPWPGEGIYLHLYALGLLGIAVAAGCFHRVACALLALGWLYLLALCQTAFAHGPYLIALLAGLLAAVPAHRMLSLDAWRRPGIRGDWVPRWTLLSLRFQIGVVIGAAGIGMLSADWRAGYPLRLWLPEHQGLALLGWLHGEPAVAVGLSWALLALHLAGVPALCWRRSRALALAGFVAAYAWLHQTFGAGVFAGLVVAGAALYLPPGWPRRVFQLPRREAVPEPAAVRWTPGRRAIAAGLVAWLALQLALPVPGLVFPVETAWTERGRPFAWRVLQWQKTGTVYLEVRGAAAARRVDPERDLTPHQARIVATDPWLLREYARSVSRRQAGPDGAPPAVRAFTLVTLNGREPQRLVDPDRDLASTPAPRFSTPDWILPLAVPLERQWRPAAPR
jgi:hypothetical protein